MNNSPWNIALLATFLAVLAYAFFVLLTVPAKATEGMGEWYPPSDAYVVFHKACYAYDPKFKTVAEAKAGVDKFISDNNINGEYVVKYIMDNTDGKGRQIEYLVWHNKDTDIYAEQMLFDISVGYCMKLWHIPENNKGT